MNVLFSIPEAQQLDLLNHWLGLDDILSLDSAVCSRKERSELLTLLASPGCVFGQFDCPEEADAWVLQRNIKFRALDIGYKFLIDEERRRRFLQHYGPYIKSLDIGLRTLVDQDPLRMDAVFIEVAQFCPLLARLFIDEGTLYEGQSLAQLIDNSKHLQELIFESCYDISSGILRAICSSSSLQTLMFKHQTEFNTFLVGASEDAFPIEAASGCPALTYLVIYDVDLDSDQLHQFTQHMPHLVRANVDVVSGDDLVILARNCPNVLEARIRINESFDETHARIAASHWTAIRLLYVIIRDETNPMRQAVCDGQTMLVFVEQCLSLLELRLASEDTKLIGDHKLDMSEITTETGSQLLKLTVPCLTETDLIRVLQLCKELYTLHIHNPDEFAWHDESIEPAEHHLHHLNGTSVIALHLTNCFNLQPSHLQQLRTLEKLVLRTVGIKKPPNNKQVIAALAQNTSLNTLVAHDSVYVTVRDLYPILKVCPQLSCVLCSEYLYPSPYYPPIEPVPFSTKEKAMMVEARKKFPQLRTFEVRLKDNH